MFCAQSPPPSSSTPSPLFFSLSLWLCPLALQAPCQSWTRSWLSVSGVFPLFLPSLFLLALLYTLYVLFSRVSSSVYNAFFLSTSTWPSFFLFFIPHKFFIRVLPSCLSSSFLPLLLHSAFSPLTLSVHLSVIPAIFDLSVKKNRGSALVIVKSNKEAHKTIIPGMCTNLSCKPAAYRKLPSRDSFNCLVNTSYSLHWQHIYKQCQARLNGLLLLCLR